MHQFTNAKCVFKGVKFSVLVGEIKGRTGYSPREVVVHPGAVVILPLLDEEHLVLIRNERFAVNDTLWELPAGTLEPEESPDDTAVRELIEETGYRAKSIEHLNTFYTTPGFCNEKMISYVAKDLEYVGQNLDDNEQIEVEILSWDQVNCMIRDGTIKDAKTLTTLLYYVFRKCDRIK